MLETSRNCSDRKCLPAPINFGDSFRAPKIRHDDLYKTQLKRGTTNASKKQRATLQNHHIQSPLDHAGQSFSSTARTDETSSRPAELRQRASTAVSRQFHDDSFVCGKKSATRRKKKWRALENGSGTVGDEVHDEHFLRRSETTAWIGWEWRLEKTNAPIIPARSYHASLFGE